TSTHRISTETPTRSTSSLAGCARSCRPARSRRYGAWAIACPRWADACHIVWPASFPAWPLAVRHRSVGAGVGARGGMGADRPVPATHHPAANLRARCVSEPADRLDLARRTGGCHLEIRTFGSAPATALFRTLLADRQAGTERRTRGRLIPFSLLVGSDPASSRERASTKQRQ